MSLYGANGQINLTTVSGSSYTGLQAPDGSYNIVTNSSSSYVGLHHACGALNAFVVTDSSAGYYAKNGSLNVIANVSSPSGFSPVQPSGSPATFPLSGAIIDENFATSQFFPRAITSEITNTVTTPQVRLLRNAAGGLTSIGTSALPITTLGAQFDIGGANNQLDSQNASGGWVANGGTLTANASVAPDGTTTASHFVQAASGSNFYIVQPSNSSFTNGSTYTTSVYIKPGTGRYFAIRVPIHQFSGTWAWIVYDSQANTFTSVATISQGSELLSNGWIRIWLTYQPTSTLSNDTSILFLANGTTVPAVTDGTPPNFTGTGLVFDSWGFQTEPAKSTGLPTPYMPTTTSTLVRTADNPVIQRTGLGTVNLTFSDGTTQSLYPSFTGQLTLQYPLSKAVIARMTGFATIVPFRQVTSTVAMANGTFAAAQAMSAQPMTVLYAANTLQIVIPNSSVETNNGGTLTATASIEYPSGVFTPFKFTGSNTGVTSGMFLVSDELPVSIPAGTGVNIRIWGSSSNSAFSSPQHYFTGTFSDGSTCQFGATVTDSTLTGGAITNTSNGIMLCATVLAARHKSRAVACYGDSICQGIGNTGGTSGESPHSGLFAPALLGTIATANYGFPGDSVAGFVASNANRVGVMAPYFSSFVTNYGINDLNTRTGAQVIADRTTMASQLAPYGPLIQSTITPEATSTDNFATAVNQTTAGLNAQRVIVNNNVRSLPVFIDCGGAAGLEDGLNTGIWKNVGDGSAGAATTATGSPWVGIHPTNFGYGIANAQVNPAIFT